MNIFVLDADPELCAQYHCDKHVVKMIVETAQMLSTCHRQAGTVSEVLYKAAYFNHPVTKWVMFSEENYEWTYQLFKALAEQYRSRYGKEHHSWKILRRTLSKPPASLESKGITAFIQCMPERYKQNDAVQAYREYYRKEKIKLATWRNGAPDWILGGV